VVEGFDLASICDHSRLPMARKNMEKRAEILRKCMSLDGCETRSCMGVMLAIAEAVRIQIEMDLRLAAPILDRGDF
jgi:hypothetical protein